MNRTLPTLRSLPTTSADGPVAAYVCRGCGTEIVNKNAFRKCPVCGITYNCRQRSKMRPMRRSKTRPPVRAV
jgi:rubrerythrin